MNGWDVVGSVCGGVKTDGVVTVFVDSRPLFYFYFFNSLESELVGPYFFLV